MGFGGRMPMRSSRAHASAALRCLPPFPIVLFCVQAVGAGAMHERVRRAEGPETSASLRALKIKDHAKACLEAARAFAQAPGSGRDDPHPDALRKPGKQCVILLISE